jgi:hypothetical protein
MATDKTAKESPITPVPKDLKGAGRELKLASKQIEHEMFALINKLATIGYESISSQLDDAIRVGDLARSVREIRAAADRL